MVEDTDGRARAEGRLEARHEALEARTDRHEVWIAGEIKSLNQKLEHNGNAIDELLRMVVAMSASQTVAQRWTGALVLVVGSALSGIAVHFLSR